MDLDKEDLRRVAEFAGELYGSWDIQSGLWVDRLEKIRSQRYMRYGDDMTEDLEIDLSDDC
ncbi:hypothetical protein BKH46_08550 [Helicobacter sp. 12S02634-8]|uniref:hypothetical protein n=1 Tax=Helicobacter sp. 12S02634-8 TaxID=1476199 RepID=UPI000BA6B140|nr:hypothetical protein [Helicobacter sp. 12S02634-8]PAF46177.1 hypothetical protein BKH46_08550 [Helicobacter sp. 12S02634-8]